MITTSQDYKEMLRRRERKSRLEIVVSNGERSITLRNRDIIQRSFDMNWRSSNNKDFSLGSVYSTSFNFTALQALEDQIVGNSLQITPTVYYDLGNGSEEAFPLGEFRCNKPVLYTRTTAYECYDRMLSFDVPVTSQMNGTPFNCLSFICNTCGVPLGTTQQDINRMANPTQLCVIDPAEINTLRDAISYIAKIEGAYCQIGRDGKFYLRQFHTSYDSELPRSRRKSAAFSGYKTVIAGVKCRFLANQNYEPYSYIPENEGIIIDLGDIPIINDTPAIKHRILKNIYDNALANIEYFPCSIEMAGDPSIEAGDMIRTKDREGYDKNILLTSVTYKWREDSQYVSEGSDPNLNDVSTERRRQQQREEKAEANARVVTATYVNAGEITVTDSEQEEVTSLRFVTNKDMTAIFGAEIPVYSDGDGYVTIGYYDGGVQGDVVKARVQAGYNLITLVNHLPYDASRVVLLQLKAQTEGIGAGTAPTVTIEQNTIRSYIFAQGIETEAPWDGIISISETIEYVEARMSMYGLTDGVTVSLHEPVEQGLSDVVASMVSELNVYGLSDTVSVSLEYGDQILRMGEGHRAGMGRMYARF